MTTRIIGGRRMRLRSILIAAATATAALGAPAAQVVLSPAAGAQVASNPYQRGPNPPPASISAPRGSFATAQTTVSRTSALGQFGGGTIYYPTSTAEGRFGAVAIAPGFTATQSSIAWLGP